MQALLLSAFRPVFTGRGKDISALFSYAAPDMHRLSMGSERMDAIKIVRELLPAELLEIPDEFPKMEELRLRVGRKPGIVMQGREIETTRRRIDQETLMQILEKATGASMHAAAATLQNGFVSYRGIRIGVCGEVACVGEEIIGMRCVGSLAIRIPHACTEEVRAVIESLFQPDVVSTLIVGAPGAGKTSLLREMIRCASSRALIVSVIDERNELSASFGGRAQYDLGPCCDVMIGARKEKASMMLLRGMNPQIIAMDEISQKEDLRVIEQVAGCGVILFATAHGEGRDEMIKRPLYRRLLQAGYFHQMLTIRCLDGKRVYEREYLHA